ncbi:MAG: hypothetical protein NZ699_04155 [Roseiflexus sp.]|nr:hypothetical protein [Roseiflexus sp.]MCS7288307.1 hypothetical protein [Roseiflexus sp.]MDW8148919.1 hypothetical protein [Roseiflexaceae bacterium]
MPGAITGIPCDANSALRRVCLARRQRHHGRGLVFRPVWNSGLRLRPKAPPDCAIYPPSA